jgi:glycosyltransferase involved in cell wall biosynthesis
MISLGVIVIGRNEGPRLATCIQCVRNAQLTGGTVPIGIIGLVYVDSNSTDDSVEIARSLGAEVIELDPAIPFTAARARNAGAEILLKNYPQVQFLQFVDGDTELHPKWLTHGIDYLTHHAHVAVVCGRRRERFPDVSVYNLLADMEWDTPIGQASEFGGDALIRADVFLHLSGYNATFIAGEEPDFSARIRNAGHSIVRLNHEMTLHDLAMRRFSQWWKRTVRSGHALAQLSHTHGGPPLFFYKRAWKSTLVWAAVVPLLILLASVFITLWCLALAPLAYSYLAFRIFRYRRRRGDDRDSAVAYAFFTTIGKFPQLLGLLTFYRNHWAHRPSLLIEYKSAAAPPAANPAPAAIGNT